MMGIGVAPEVRETLGKLDRLTREQYLDYINFRRYRESLLCHAGVLSRFVVQPSRVLGMHALASPDLRGAATSAAPAPSEDAETGALKEFLLARWPNSVPVRELGSWRERTLPATASGPSLRPIEVVMSELYVTGIVDLRMVPAAVAALPGERPEVFAAARWINREHDVIPNLYNEALRIQDAGGRKLLGLLDGTKTRDELIAAIGGPFSGPGGRAHLDDALTVLAKKALLVR
jgi:hypothetical protein